MRSTFMALLLVSSSCQVLETGLATRAPVEPADETPDAARPPPARDARPADSPLDLVWPPDASELFDTAQAPEAPRDTALPDRGARETGTDLTSDVMAPAPSISLDDLPAVVARTYCQRRFDCCTRDEIGGTTASDRTRCEAATTLDLTDVVSDVRAGISRRRVSYDGVRLAAELDQWKALSCGSARDLSSTGMVVAALVAMVRSGGACRRHWECADGFCPDDLPGVDGACVSPRQNDGTHCFADEECRSGNCLGGTCAPRAGNALCLADP